jgi:ABC-type multidrug transport system fused ATPase/permease subunit
VKIFQKGEYDRSEALQELVSLVVFKVMGILVNGQLDFIGKRVATRTRVVLSNEIYSKSLKIPSNRNSDDKASFGKIVTLMSVDTEQIREFLSYLQECFISFPLSLIISLFSLYAFLGWSSLIGFAIIALIGPITANIGKYVLRYEKHLLQKTDSRINAINEVLQGIRIIKYCAWESHFCDKLDKSRKDELDAMIRLFISKIGLYSFGSGGSIIISLVTFMVYTVFAGNSLDPATAFTAVSLLDQLTNLTTYFPHHVMQLLKARISLHRICEFLGEQEIDTCEPHKKSFISLKDAEFEHYSANIEGKFTLRDISVDFPIGKLTLIAGSTGAGKSSLLTALLGEMKLVRGSVFFPTGKNRIVNPNTGLSETVAYAAQTPWLLNATIRDNILFGEEYDEKRYNAVIKGCALAKDLENLEGGDLTEIGEKGINVSGGQKQRISLARVCYSRAAYVLLDDPLSAVDAPTARFLLHKCIVGLLKGRTIILVSHATAIVLPFSDHVILMANGEIITQGSPEQISLISHEEIVKNILQRETTLINLGENDSQIKSAKGDVTQFVLKELKPSGSVRFSVYQAYFNAAGGFPYFLLFISTFIVVDGIRIWKDWWLKVWSDSSLEISLRNCLFCVTSNSTTSAKILEVDAWYYVSIYALIGLITVIYANLREGIYVFGSFLASRNLHSRMVRSILYSPVRFFEITPIGRILNRFSKDIASIDNSVLFAIMAFVFQVFLAAMIISIIASVSVLFLICIPFVAIVYIFISQIYLMTSRELKRIESTQRSPIYAHFSETLNGISTIRAFNAQMRFIFKNRQNINSNHKPYHFMWVANRWLCIRSEIMAVFVVLVAGLAIIYNKLSPGLAAFVLVYSFDFTSALMWGARMHAEMEMCMNSGNF